jgi:hypothetical protein
MEDGSSDHASFNEPGGITYAGGMIYLSDTNNHLIRVIDASTGKVSTLILKGIEKLNAKPQEKFNIKDYKGEVVKAPKVNFSNLDSVSFELKLPEGYKINDLAESGVKIFTADGKVNVDGVFSGKKLSKKVEGVSSAGTLYAEVIVYYCREGNEGLCLIKDVLYEIDNDPASSISQANIEINLN